MLPVAIYLFLQIFGDNEFNLPFIRGKEEVRKCLADDWPEINKPKYQLIFLFQDKDYNREEKIQLDRIYERYGKQLSFHHLDHEQTKMSQIKTCLGLSDFLVSEEKDTNLIHEKWLIFLDEELNIRGFYLLDDLDDIDRLLVEIDILEE
jgi:hypothetical protein